MSLTKEKCIAWEILQEKAAVKSVLEWSSSNRKRNLQIQGMWMKSSDSE